MFELFMLLLSLLGVQFTAYEDCTIAASGAPTPIIRAIEEYNDLPDQYRECSDSAWRWEGTPGPTKR